MWDPLVRIGHWVLVIAVVLGWLTRHGGGAWHNIEADDLDDTQSAARKEDGRGSLEPGFREAEAWQDARPTDERAEEEDGRPAEPARQNAGERAKRKAH